MSKYTCLSNPNSKSNFKNNPRQDFGVSHHEHRPRNAAKKERHGKGKEYGASQHLSPFPIPTPKFATGLHVPPKASGSTERKCFTFHPDALGELGRRSLFAMRTQHSCLFFPQGAHGPYGQAWQTWDTWVKLSTASYSRSVGKSLTVESFDVAKRGFKIEKR